MNVAMRLLEKKKELPKKRKSSLKKSLLEAQKKSDRCVCRAGFCAGA